MVLLVGFLGIAAAAAVAFVMMKKQPAGDTTSIAPSAAIQARASAEPSTPEAPAASNAPLPRATRERGWRDQRGSRQPAARLSQQAAASAASAKPVCLRGRGRDLNRSRCRDGRRCDPCGNRQPSQPIQRPPRSPRKLPLPQQLQRALPSTRMQQSPRSAPPQPAPASCKTADGPTGSGKVSVTFAPSGRATATSVAGELAGTEVGGCVARLFRAAKVPPFSGDPVTVSKSFTVQ